MRGYDTYGDGDVEAPLKSNRSRSNTSSSDINVVEYPNARHWWSSPYFKAGVVCAVVILLGVVIIAIALPISISMTNDDGDNGHSIKKLFSFDDVFTMSASGFSLQWLTFSPAQRDATTNAASKYSSFVYQTADRSLIQQTLYPNITAFPDVSTQRLIYNFSSSSSLASCPLTSSWFSLSATAMPDETMGLISQYMLLACNYTKVWRHSFSAKFYVYNISTETLAPLDPASAANITMNPIWSPIDNHIAYVKDNNIMIADLAKGQNIQVTTDGTPGRTASGELIINGVQSWIYEEEIYGGMNAIWWSPNGTKIAFLCSNETAVPKFVVDLYQGGAYPIPESVDYPKAGYPNPIVTVKVYDLATGNLTVLDMGATVASDSYISNIVWADDVYLSVTALNRDENDEQTFLVDTSTFAAPRLLKTKQATWIEPTYNLIFLESAEDSALPEYFVDTAWNPLGYLQIGLYNYSTGEFVRYITDPQSNNEWSVTAVLAWDPINRLIYYTSMEVSPMERHIYSISVDDAAKKNKLTAAPGWWSANMGPILPSSSYSYYVLSFSGNGNYEQVPTTALRRIDTAEFSIVLASNNALKQRLDALNMPSVNYVNLPGADGRQLQASLLLPPNFDKDNKHPVLFNVYGGPGSQAVTKTMTLGWDAYLASKGYIIVKVDGRGTNTKDNKFMFSVYHNLGKFEVDDQISAAKHLQANYGYVDKTRMGIWGWSYGGYMAGMVGSDPSVVGVFKMAMSVAPVTDWRYYDSAYTERYMSTPEKNPSGYTNSSVLWRAANLKNVAYMLVHGLADDNVHPQNSFELSKQLVESEVDFQEMIYTNQDHSINTDGSRQHLYHHLENFLEQHLLA